MRACSPPHRGISQSSESQLHARSVPHYFFSFSALHRYCCAPSLSSSLFFSSSPAYLLNAATASKSPVTASSSTVTEKPAAVRQEVEVDAFGLPDVPMRNLNA